MQALKRWKSLQIGQRLEFNQLLVLLKAAHFTLLGVNSHPLRVIS
jgi:hypothetical protein